MRGAKPDTMESQAGARGRIDNYHVVDRSPIGKTCGTYLVWDITRRRPATLKLAHAAGGPSSVAVLHETWILGRLQHAGIPTLVDFGLAADGRPWFASAPVRSKTIARLKDGLFLALEVAEMIGDVAEILDHAHQHGVIVRSLKPETIALREAVEGMPTAITDWSDAQVCGQRAPLFSADNAYLAPELARGDAGDQRADIYALGAVAYWALTGVSATSTPGIGSIGGRTIEPSYISVAERCPGAPAKLTALIDQMLSLDPMNRPESCADVRDLAAQIVLEDQDERIATRQIPAVVKRWLDADQLATENDLVAV
ncbi:MAG: putative serine/threonine protein kinase [Myxococcales bacterium]|nr:putative serine/threonine protein kinase [Myxococcales bacterium]